MTSLRYHEHSLRHHGRSLHHPVKNYSEEEHIGIWITGKKETENWKVKEEPTSFFTLKANVDNILTRLGIKIENCTIDSISNDIFSEGLEYRFNNVTIGQIGYVSKMVLKKLDISADVFYGDLRWTAILKAIKNHKATYTPLLKYPEVKRDLALLIDKEVLFSTLKTLAFKAERQILRSVNIFDVYEGERIPQGKKSLGFHLIFNAADRTLQDAEVVLLRDKIVATLGEKHGATIRS